MDKTSEILKERGNKYGDFTDHARITQALKTAMRASRNWERLSDDKKEGLEMICHKIGRLLNGDPEYSDNLDDLIGYAVLMRDRLRNV